MRSTRPIIAALALLATAALSACGSESSASSATTGTVAVAGTAAVTDTLAITDTVAPGVVTGTVDINTASIAELQAAFEAVGVTNADRRAREVDEYRPYDAGDTDFAQLRQELGKYNIDPAQLELIISTLTL